MMIKMITDLPLAGGIIAAITAATTSVTLKMTS